jgi:hypothetical protein
MNKENSQFKAQGCPSRTEKVEWHTESKLEESECHHNTPDGSKNFVNRSVQFLLGTGAKLAQSFTKGAGHTFTSKKLCSAF